MLLESLAAMALVAGPAAPQDARAAPRGSYRQSCSEAYVHRGRLYADCRDARGRMRGTSLDLSRCGSHEIRNDNGRLVCGRRRGEYENGPGRPGRPGGGHDDRGSSITVYRDANFGGASLRFDGAVPNLANTGFNDVISSMRFRGEWEACTDAYFRGQCRTFRDDVRNLQQHGMNDRISSLRPVRRGGR